MLHGIELDKVHEHQIRLIGGEDELRHIEPVCIRQTPRQRLATGDFDGIEQVRRRCHLQEHEALRMIGPEVGSPEFGDVEIDVHTDGYGPRHRAGCQAARTSGAEQRRNLDGTRIPVARIARAILRIEHAVVQDAVDRRVDTGHECGVCRIGHRGKDTDHSLRRCPLVNQFPDHRDARGSRRGIGRRHHAIDRDHQHVHVGPRGQCDGRGNQRQQSNERA